MLITMILVAALLSGAAVVVSMQLTSNRSTQQTRSGISALYCAEAGLIAARAAVASGYTQWEAALEIPPAAPVQPSWLSNTAFSHDLDGDGIDDFVITIKDNDDETTGANDLTKDVDQKIYVKSKCLMYADDARQVMELIEYTPTANCYGSQEGGCNGRGNSN